MLIQVWTGPQRARLQPIVHSTFGSHPAVKETTPKGTLMQAYGQSLFTTCLKVADLCFCKKLKFNGFPLNVWVWRCVTENFYDYGQVVGSSEEFPPTLLWLFVAVYARLDMEAYNRPLYLNVSHCSVSRSESRWPQSLIRSGIYWILSVGKPTVVWVLMKHQFQRINYRHAVTGLK